MLLAIDVGNTNFTMGLFREEELVAKFRMTTKLPRTSDEYGIAIRELIRNQGEDPDQVDDIIVASVVPVIVVDFGTATTYDLVEPDGTFAVGVTAPGIRTSARALWGDAAMLPEIEIRKPETILARETVSSMQAGLVYGYIGQTEYIISQMKKESGYTDAKVVATGGLGNILAAATESIDIYDPILTLEGLRLVYERNRFRSRRPDGKKDA